MKIIQHVNKTHSQMMAYTVVSKSGHVLVIDGGETGDTAELKRVINKVGGHVHLWLISHPHCDHHNAIIALLNDPEGITYDRIGESQLTDGWADLAGTDDTEELLTWNAFARESLDERYFDLEAGQVFELGSMKVEVLSVCNPEILANPINNQSSVLRISEDGFVFLVTGDLGVEGGEKLLASGAGLRADAVQMAHHGQSGVAESFYRAVAPGYAFWPTPDWLWYNRSGDGVDGAGPFRTPEVAKWMEKLGTVNVIDFENTVAFDSVTKDVSVF